MEMEGVEGSEECRGGGTDRGGQEERGVIGGGGGGGEGGGGRSRVKPVKEDVKFVCSLSAPLYSSAA